MFNKNSKIIDMRIGIMIVALMTLPMATVMGAAVISSFNPFSKASQYESLDQRTRVFRGGNDPGRHQPLQNEDETSRTIGYQSAHADAEKRAAYERRETQRRIALGHDDFVMGVDAYGNSTKYRSTSNIDSQEEMQSLRNHADAAKWNINLFRHEKLTVAHLEGNYYNLVEAINAVEAKLEMYEKRLKAVQDLSDAGGFRVEQAPQDDVTRHELVFQSSWERKWDLCKRLATPGAWGSLDIATRENVIKFAAAAIAQGVSTLAGIGLTVGTLGALAPVMPYLVKGINILLKYLVETALTKILVPTKGGSSSGTAGHAAELNKEVSAEFGVAAGEKLAPAEEDRDRIVKAGVNTLKAVGNPSDFKSKMIDIFRDIPMKI